MKKQLLQAIINNERIVDIIGNGEVAAGKFDPADLIGENVFPYPYIPETQADVKTCICFDIYAPRIEDKIFKTVQIVLNIFSHKNEKTYKNDVRVDILNVEMDKILNGNYGYGIDSVELKSVLPYCPNNNYYGKQLVYNVLKLNQKGCIHNEHKV